MTNYQKIKAIKQGHFREWLQEQGFSMRGLALDLGYEESAVRRLVYKDNSITDSMRWRLLDAVMSYRIKIK